MGSIITLSIVQSALELGFIYALVALALLYHFHIRYRGSVNRRLLYIRLCSLCDGDACRTSGVRTVCGGGSRSCIGIRYCILQTRMGIQSILAGIIVNTGLYTINIAVMGFASNINLFPVTRFFMGERSYRGNLV